MKKLTALLLSVVLVLSLAACGSANKPASSTTQPETSAPTEQPESSSTAPAESEPETQPETGKTLVIYYSASGNTARVAKDIAEAAGADLFEIVPTEVYTSEDLNWTNPDSRVSREHDDESLRDVPLTTTEVPDWDSYDTVFIGYPIWWGIAAWPVDTFVKNNDFTGKTVIPFATSSSSGINAVEKAAHFLFTLSVIKRCNFRPIIWRRLQRFFIFKLLLLQFAYAPAKKMRDFKGNIPLTLGFQ